jgi:ATP-dependent DNA helicase RecG
MPLEEFIAKQVGRALSTIERASSKLVREGKLRHAGPKKGGYWEIIK